MCVKFQGSQMAGCCGIMGSIWGRGEEEVSESAWIWVYDTSLESPKTYLSDGTKGLIVAPAVAELLTNQVSTSCTLFAFCSSSKCIPGRATGYPLSTS